MRSTFVHVLVCLLAAVGVATSGCAQEPPMEAGLYRQKPVSYWIRRLASVDLKERRLAARALRAIGVTDADTLGRLMYTLETMSAPLDTGADERRRRQVVREIELALRRAGKPAVPGLLRILREGKPAARQMAVELLGMIGGRDLGDVAPILEAAEDTSSRWYLSDAIASIGAPAIPKLVAALQDPRAANREVAAGALGEMGATAREAVPGLIKALGDEDEEVRGTAVAALGRIGSSEYGVIPALRKALQDPDEWVRSAAIESLGAVGGIKVIPDLLDCIHKGDAETVKSVVASLASMGQAAVPEMIRMLASKDGDTVDIASSVLDEMGEVAVPALLEAERKPSTRYWALRTLVWMDYSSIPPPVLERVMAALGSPDKDLRELIQSRLFDAYFGDGEDRIRATREGVRILIKAFEQGDRETRLAVLEIMASEWPVLALAGAVPFLVKAVGHPDAGVRGAAAEALGAICRAPEAYDPKAFRLDDAKKVPRASRRAAVEALARLLDDADASVRKKAIESLGPVCGSPWSTRPHAAPPPRVDGIPEVLRDTVVAALVKRLDDEVPAVREDAAIALGCFGAAAEPAVPRLTAMLDEGRMRMCALNGLGGIGPKSAPAVPKILSLIEAFAEDGNPWGFEQVFQVLRSIGPGAKAALPRMLAILERSPKAAARFEVTEAIGAMGPEAAEAVPALVGMVKRADEYLFKRSILALARIGPSARDAVPTLKQALENKDEEIRSCALYALSRTCAADVTPAIIARLKRGDTFEVPPLDQPLRETDEVVMWFWEKAVPSIAGLIGDPDAKVRERAAAMLSALKPFSKPAVPVLVKLLNHQEAAIRKDVASVLAEIGAGSREAIPPLVLALEDDDPGVRAAAAEALGVHGSAAREAIPVLVRRLQVEDTATAGEVVMTLGKIGRDAAGTVPAILKALASSNPKLRAAVYGSAEYALEEMGESIIPMLTEALLDDGARDITYGLLQAFPQNSVPALIAKLEDDDPEVREVAVGHLRSLHREARASYPALAKALEDASPFVRGVAVQAVAAVSRGSEHWAQAATILKGALHDEDPDIRKNAISELICSPFNKALDWDGEIVKKLADADPVVRQRAAEILWGNVDEIVMRALEKASKDMDLGVRREAKEALQRIKAKE